MSHPSQIIVREWLSYDCETGAFRWRAAPWHAPRAQVGNLAGTHRKATGYRFIQLPGFPQIGAHRLAWIYVHGAIPDGMEIDHIDGNPSNNAIRNLRVATSRQQKQNKRVQSNNRSGLKGAFYHAAHKGKKWRSQIKTERGLIFLGYFHTAEEAHAAYARAAAEQFGEFGRAA